MFRGETVIVESVGAIGDEDVVAGEAFSRFDPSGVEAQFRVAFEKSIGQYLTGAIGEEMPVRPVPAPDRIILDVDFLGRTSREVRVIDDFVSELRQRGFVA